MLCHTLFSLLMVFVLCALATLVHGLPSSQQQQRSDRVRDSVQSPRGWKRTKRAETDTVIHLQIGLKHDGFKELERRLYEISDPSHQNYGRHLSRSDVAELARPSEETLRKAEEWLLEHNITGYDMMPGKDWIRAVLPVRRAETLLGTEFYHFESENDGDVLVRTLEWSLPGHLRDHIDVVQPTNSFLRAVPQDRYGGIPKPAWEVEGRVPTYEELVEEDLIERGHLDIPALADLPSKPTVADACNRLAVSSLCLRVLYGTLDYKVQQPANATTNKVGVVNFLNHNNNRSDIARYLELYRPDAAAAGAADAFKTVLVAGGVDQQTPNTPEQMSRAMGLEGALDVETLLGVAHPVPLVAWNVGGRPPFRSSVNKVENSNEPYLEWLHYLAGLDDADLPKVISVSYADEEQTVPPRYAARVCEAFAQLGARGVSVIVASGDEGVGKDGKCVTNDGKETPRFMPTFPASCPYVTAVGGTRHFDPVIAGFDARGGFSTGGGFSDYFSRPHYQEHAVAPYITSLNGTHHGLYNPRGRGIPDVAAAAYHFPVVWNGTSHLLDGTSASAPTFAAIIALVNDALLAEGRPPLGFLNPWLYSSGLPGLRDVTIGSNRGCDTTGFPAVEGWDAAAGLGTPWFPVLRQLALRDAFRWDHPWYVTERHDR